MLPPGNRGWVGEQVPALSPYVWSPPCLPRFNSLSQVTLEPLLLPQPMGLETLKQRSTLIGVWSDHQSRPIRVRWSPEATLCVLKLEPKQSFPFPMWVFMLCKYLERRYSLLLLA